MSETAKIDKKLSLLALAWPIFIETALRMLMGNADTLMLSHYSDDAVAAVGVANQLVSILIVMYGFVSMGTGIVVSQCLGAQNRAKAREVIVVALAVNLLFGLLLSGALFVFGTLFLKAMNLPPELMQYAQKFLNIVGGLSFIEAVSMTAGVAVRAHGYTRDAMFVTLGMNVLNIAGNFLFLFGPFGLPVLGVTGVGISTTFARLVALVVMFAILRKRVEGQLPFASLRQFPKDSLMSILKIGVPAAGEVLSYNTSQVLITYFISLMGAESLTTRVYTQNLMSFIYLFSLSLASATQIQVGHFVGAGETERAYHRCMKSLRISLVMALLMAGVVSLLRHPLMSLFTQNAHIIAMGGTLILMTLILEPGRTFNLVIISSLRAAGDAKFPVYMGILSMWGFAVTLAYLLGIHFHFGLVGVWIAFAFDEWFRGLFMLWRWRTRKWEKMSFIRRHEPNAQAAQA